MAFALKKYRKQILAAVALLIGLLIIALLAWTLYLDRKITAQFEGRRWTLPAQVYAEPTDLYVGQVLSADALEQELIRLGYHRARRASSPGAYSRDGNRIELVSRRFPFWDGLQESQRLTIVTHGNAIFGMRDASGEEIPIFRLDPLLIGSIFPVHGEDRVVVTPQEVSPLLPTALKVVEDRQFDSHLGVDFSAIARAAWVNLRAGHIAQGGSTLTQQLVKSYFLDNRRTFSRKIEEAVMAMLLEVHFEKQDLMNAYINEIYLGQDGRRAIHGFGLASQFYFGKPLAELQLHEVALLVAIVRGPSYYDPRRHPQRARERRDLVLELMARHGVIDNTEAQQAAKQPLGILGADNRAGGYYPAFLDLVRRTLRRDYREEDLTEAGLKIFSTLDPRIQNEAEKSLAQELDRLDRTRRQPAAHKLEGVVIVTAPQNGEVIAMVGGRQAGFDGFNRALDAHRSIGSLVKPVIYLAAIETGLYNAATLVEDGPVEVKLPNGKLWQPQNISKQYYGPVPLVRALAQSLNLATVHLGLEVGLPKVTRKFVALGLGQEPPQLPAVLLGAVDVSPLEVAQLYNGFANGGFSTPLRAVRAVVDEQGKPLKSFALEITPVADPKAVYEVNRMLVQVMEHGSGRAARSRLPADVVVAGKTGTSSDYRDSWFAGFSGNHLAVVWIGYDDNAPTGLTGASGSLAVWSRLMGSIDTASWSAALPEGLEETWIEFATGLAARPGCGDDVILIAVPRDTRIPARAGCEADPSQEPANAPPLQKQAHRWWQGIIRRP
ncbi:penicillin-binding protein 1B [Steroidobacter denitrificans]|uniref:Penicillin-binding protein 1B n=1 Tax=Steroidobacter denitrificans TaxID=465721 RepID=A0A127FEV6_STEDE|nr:penicillin-binding protein 1B [Steroidobacter denitrificans]AMN48455.1 penicillin-binding protein 1B [Steroidobacter denitrificans]